VVRHVVVAVQRSLRNAFLLMSALNANYSVAVIALICPHFPTDTSFLNSVQVNAYKYVVGVYDVFVNKLIKHLKPLYSTTQCLQYHFT